MSEAHLGSVAKDAPEVFLDGFRVSLPKARRSVASIRAYLERLALEQQRILCSFHVVEDYPTGDQQRRADKPQTRVEALTIDLTQTPLYLILTAREQAAQAKAQLESAVVLVLINDRPSAAELWWKLTADLKSPLLTLSLLPETTFNSAETGVSLAQLRKWQLQQLGAIIREIDDASGTEDPRALSNLLENRALPWLSQLERTLELCHETLLASLPGATEPLSLT
jgi:hypothetical protein